MVERSSSMSLGGSQVLPAPRRGHAYTTRSSSGAGWSIASPTAALLAILMSEGGTAGPGGAGHG
jgi:hypothetical protein